MESNVLDREEEEAYQKEHVGVVVGLLMKHWAYGASKVTRAKHSVEKKRSWNLCYYQVGQR